MPRPPAQKTVVLWLCRNLFLQTDGSTSDTNFEIDLPEAGDWGPYLLSIRALTVTRNRTSNFQWKPTMRWSIDGSNFVPIVDLCADITSNGQAVQSAFSDQDQLGLQLRFGVACANTTGSALEQGTVSCALVFVFRT